MQRSLFPLFIASLALALALTLTSITPVLSSPLVQRDSSSSSSSGSTYGVDASGFKHVRKAAKKLNIVLTNDDSWASANVRATYYALRRAGHKVQMVAPAVQQSGKGGTVVLPTSNLTGPAAYDSAPAGAPFFGRNASDPGLTYFNGTPTAAAFWALDQVKPFEGDIDLFVSGPNEGTNLGPFLYTLSGTIGATYAAVGRGVPGIAFSASSSARDYKTLNLDSTKDESVIIGTATANFVTTYADTIGKYQRSKKAPLLPNGIGLNVNYSPLNSTLCPRLEPKFKRTRMTGGAYSDELVLNSAGFPVYSEIAPERGGLNTCSSGDCGLQGETQWVESGDCKASVTLFSVDYDAPSERVEGASKAIDAVVNKLNA